MRDKFVQGGQILCAEACAVQVQGLLHEILFGSRLPRFCARCTDTKETRQNRLHFVERGGCFGIIRDGQEGAMGHHVVRAITWLESDIAPLARCQTKRDIFDLIPSSVTAKSTSIKEIENILEKGEAVERSRNLAYIVVAKLLCRFRKRNVKGRSHDARRMLRKSTL